MQIEILSPAYLPLVRRLQPVAEGLATSFTCRQFSEKIGLELPLMYQMHEVLVNGLNLKKLVAGAVTFAQC